MENNKLFKALVSFQKDVPKIELDSQVSAGQFRFKYASLKEIIGKIKPTLAKNGLFVNTAIIDKQISVQILHESGEHISYNSGIEIPVNADAKKTGAYITYMKRYALVAALGLVADEDKDAPPPIADKPQDSDLKKRFLAKLKTAKTAQNLQVLLPHVHLAQSDDEYLAKLKELMEKAKGKELEALNGILDSLI